MKYKLFMTSRYGRKIKLRYADTNESNKGFNSTADADSDEARQDFDDNYKKHSNKHVNMIGTSSMVATTSAAAIGYGSTASNSYDGPSNPHMTRSASNRRLRSSHSVNFNLNNIHPTTSSSIANGHSNLNNGHSLRSSTAIQLDKSYFTKDVSESENSDKAEEIEINNNSNRHENGDNDDYFEDSYENSNSSKKLNSNKKENEYSSRNGCSSNMNALHHNEDTLDGSSIENVQMKTNSSHKNDADVSDNQSTGKYTDEDYENEEEDEEEEEEEEVEISNESNSDSEIKYKKPRVNHNKKAKATKTTKRSCTRKISSSTSKNTRTSKRSRKQFSYKESSYSSDDSLSDSCSKKSTASNGRQHRIATAQRPNGRQLRNARKKQRRFSPSTAVTC